MSSKPAITGNVESLETRRHLSGAPNTFLDDGIGILTVTGTAHADRITFMREDGWLLRVYVNHKSIAYPIDVIKGIEINAGSGDDKVIIGEKNIPTTINGDAGDDSLSGGEGNDFIDGGAGADYLFGRGGNDTVRGGPGSDEMLGGVGTDSVDYSDYTTPVNVQLDGKPNDGYMPSAHDNVRGDIEVVFGGKAGDYLDNPTNRPVVLIGGPGDDTLVGQSGQDTLEGGAGANQLWGGPVNRDT
jgi:Ca2+-binding RTX toxin-like protein